MDNSREPGNRSVIAWRIITLVHSGHAIEPGHWAIYSDRGWIQKQWQEFVNVLSAVITNSKSFILCISKTKRAYNYHSKFFEKESAQNCLASD